MASIYPPKPAKLRGMNNTMTITEQDYGRSASGWAIPQVGSTQVDIPCRLDTVSTSEAIQHGHSANTTIYRVRANLRNAAGASIKVAHNQTVTIDSVVYEVIGEGQPQGQSGIQTLIVKREGQ